ncbi:N-acetylmuramoyl-L-alanine amidase [Calothrix sp. FACHB-1219]|uniref:N-acetylmuramoyl-L-alanine amidase n=1 Tax=unclassified Calothrix TaxID=2619626 RepID=UPI00168623A7|nr:MULTISPECIES: N-acetylmuramoyl-L-alanine amidase [unclassified Calothrix]MBD2203382.1 N-acetylmuramoyl-L-alanine amidase [Calothrix sp. FACHB-168]MBD2216321.1 N-acetylmuramoyl-L-alanine amidase [Calothrix sp. FACHB-1219]
MQSFIKLIAFASLITARVAWGQENTIKLVYPPTNHQTKTDKIFLLGSAPATGQVLINDQPIKRSQAGHFAPSFPLQLGENLFTVRYQNQELQLRVTRLANQAEIPQGLAFASNSLTPAVDISRLPTEEICFNAIAPVNAKVAVNIGKQTVDLLPQLQQISLPSNSAIFINKNQPIPELTPGKYRGCRKLQTGGDWQQPEFQLTFNGKTLTQPSSGKVQTLTPDKLPVVEVTAETAVARTGPSTDYSRLTPIPKGVVAAVTAKEGDWLRLDYGGWINSQETRLLAGTVATSSVIRSVTSRQLSTATEIIFPLQVPVPVSITQGDGTFTLTLHNTHAQTDIIRLDDNSVISRLDWQQIAPKTVQYTFHLKNQQQWGYKLAYRNTSLVLSLRHPPKIAKKQQQPLSGIKILLNPGQGGQESGAAGPNGVLAKDLNLQVTKLLRDELIKRGATVVMTRQDDRELSLGERQKMIEQEEPAIALTFHYRFLPDDGDAENTKGVSSYWYHPQAQSLAVLLQNRLVKNLGRPSFGVFWNNLALTRPHIAPSVLLELGFMSNPDEFEQIVNQEAQKKKAKALADGIVEWFKFR